MAKQTHRQTRYRGLKPASAILITLAFILAVQYLYGWEHVLAPWLELSVTQIFAAMALTLLTYWLRAFRVYDYYRNSMQGSFLACFKLTLWHNLLNNLLPLRTGELSFPVLMARYFAIPPKRSFPVLVWFRLMDLHTLALLATLALGVLYLPSWLVLMLSLAWLSLLWPLWRLTPLLRTYCMQKSQIRLFHLGAEVLSVLPERGVDFARAWMITVANWMVKIAVFAWVLNLFLQADMASAWLGAIGGDLSSILPVHGIAGAGSFEAGVLALLLPLGIALDTALLAAINLHLFILATAFLGGLIAFWLPKPLPTFALCDRVQTEPNRAKQDNL